MDCDEGRRVCTMDGIPVQGELRQIPYLATNHKITLRVSGFPKAPETAHSPKERSTFVLVSIV